MNVSRRQFFSFLGAGTAAAALPGCITAPTCGCGGTKSKIALQLYSLNRYVNTLKGADGKVDLELLLSNVAAIGFKGVEFAGYYGYDAKGIRAALKNAGIKACGTHVGNTD